MKRRTKLISIVALVASAVAFAASTGAAQAITLPDGPLFTFPKQPRPDLKVTTIATTWNQFTVANVGTAPAGPFTIAIGPSDEDGPCLGDAWFLPIIWKTERVNGLAVGASTQVDAEFSVVSSREQARPIQWNRWIAVDLSNEVAESNESNNRASLPGQPYSPCAHPSGGVIPL